MRNRKSPADYERARPTNGDAPDGPVEVADAVLLWTHTFDMLGKMGITHHPIFSLFAPFSGYVPGGMAADFVGSLTSREIEDWGAPRQNYQTTQPPPSFDEEYFEWIDILEAVRAAEGSFTFVEAGAGWGRWSARALKAAQQCANISTARAILIEPHHHPLAHVHMANNGFRSDEHYTLTEAALDETPGRADFYVSAPPGHVKNGQKWWGQALAGKPTRRYGRWFQSWGTAEVEVTTLAKALPAGVIDLLDMDIQGAEGRVVASSIEILSERVRRLHIGTHSHDIEEELRQSLGKAGWGCVRDYECASDTQTPFGRISFVDGVQSWVNPRWAE